MGVCLRQSLYARAREARRDKPRPSGANSDTWHDCEFSIAWAVKVDDAFAVESRIHAALIERRTNPRREFFRVTPEEARDLLALVARVYAEPMAPDAQIHSIPHEAPMTCRLKTTRRHHVELVSQKPEGRLRAWVDANYERVPLREKDTGTKLDTLYTAYTTAVPPVHQKFLGKILFAKMLNVIYPNIGPHRGRDGSTCIFLLH